MKNIFEWLKINIPQILLICGFLLLSIAGFEFNVPAGLIVSGIELIIISILSGRR